MSFTDDDLKRLKEWADGKGGDFEGIENSVKALLSRLEAAEAVASMIQSFRWNREWIDDVTPKWKAWLKECGK